MKKPIAEAAACLGLHPGELVLLLAGMVAPFDELYPVLDEGLVDTVRGMHPEILTGGLEKLSCSLKDSSTDEVRRAPHLSEEGECVVLALYNKRHWGRNTVAAATLRNHYCRGIQSFESAIRELARAGLLWPGSLRGPFSLNTRAKAQIAEIAERSARAVAVR